MQNASFSLLFILLLSVWWYVAIGYVLLMIVAYFVQDKFIFKPEKLAEDFEYKYDAPFREVNFEIAEGVKINGLHFHVKKPKGPCAVFSWQ
jgi:uncharacterized protein